MLLFFHFFTVPTIQVSYTDGRFYLKEKSFQIGWIHSVEKEPWFERYERHGMELHLVETQFKTFGAGTPSTGEIIPSDDGFVHMGVDEKMTELRLSVSKNVETTLYTEHDAIPFYELVDDYESVVVNVKKIPLWRYLRGE